MSGDVPLFGGVEGFRHLFGCCHERKRLKQHELKCCNTMDTQGGFQAPICVPTSLKLAEMSVSSDHHVNRTAEILPPSVGSRRTGCAGYRINPRSIVRDYRGGHLSDPDSSIWTKTQSKTRRAKSESPIW